jgi:Asp-tRNA(Asn)/Glu-tRNA(Gln) amidotransferase A subunit family amidase
METTIDDIHAAFRSGYTARQLVQAYLDRIAAYDKQGPTINSIITLKGRALEQSRAAAAKNPLLLADVAYYEAELAASRLRAKR